MTRYLLSLLLLLILVVTLVFSMRRKETFLIPAPVPGQNHFCDPDKYNSPYKYYEIIPCPKIECDNVFDPERCQNVI
jgi:hypothetical protein